METFRNSALRGPMAATADWILERSQCLLVSMPSHRGTRRAEASGPQTGLARALSKLGYCSRRQAWDLIKAGRVRLNGVVQRDPVKRVEPGRDRIEVDTQRVRPEAKVYLMLNKPRGLVTTASDEQGRETVFRCFEENEEWKRTAGAGIRDSGSPPIPHIFPVGRLDKASEGLLLFTNDTAWAAHITAPESHLDKTYHVHVDRLADAALARRIEEGVATEDDFLSVRRVSMLRQGTRNSWLEVVLDEGKNRHIRRLLAALGVNVLRLVRVAIGPLQLGALAKGQWRHLTGNEVQALTQTNQTHA